jgi:hypothetical protein
MIWTMITHAATIGAYLTGGRRASGHRPGSIRVPPDRAQGDRQHRHTARSVPRGLRARVASICECRCLLPQVGPFDIPAPGGMSEER